MNWDYFIDNGKFKARRLPNPQSIVNIKDVSDLYELRQDLREATSLDDAKRQYEHSFSRYDDYDVEIESLAELIHRGPSTFFKGLSLKGHELVIDKLRDWLDDDYNDEWIFIHPRVGKQLEKVNLVKIKKPLTDNDLRRYLEHKYTGTTAKELLKTAGISPTKKDKRNLIAQIMENIQSGQIKHEAACLIKPLPSMKEWFEAIQYNYIDDIQHGLLSFSYPAPFVGAIWREVIDCNQEWPELRLVVRKKYGCYLDDTDEKSLIKDHNTDHSCKVIKTTKTVTEFGQTKELVRKIEYSGPIVQFVYITQEGEQTSRSLKIDSVWTKSNETYFSGESQYGAARQTFWMKGVQNSLKLPQASRVVNTDAIRNAEDFFNLISDDRRADLSSVRITNDNKKHSDRVMWITIWSLVLIFLGIVLLLNLTK